MEPAHCSVLAAQCTVLDLESMLMRKMADIFKTISLEGEKDNAKNTHRFIIGAWSSELDF